MLSQKQKKNTQKTKTKKLRAVADLLQVGLPEEGPSSQSKLGSVASGELTGEGMNAETGGKGVQAPPSHHRGHTGLSSGILGMWAGGLYGIPM